MMTLHTREIAFVNEKVAELNELSREVKRLCDLAEDSRINADYETFKKAFNSYNLKENLLWARATRLERAFCITLDMLSDEITVKSEIVEIKDDKENLIHYYKTM